jgi:hypothetical protein
MINMYKTVMQMNTYVPEMDENIKVIFGKISKGKEYFDFEDFCEAQESLPHLFAWTHTPEEMIKMFTPQEA